MDRHDYDPDNPQTIQERAHHLATVVVVNGYELDNPTKCEYCCCDGKHDYGCPVAIAEATLKILEE